MLRDIVSHDLFTVILIAGLSIVTLAKMVAPKRFDEFVYVISNFKYLKIYAREQKFFDKFDALLFINLTLNLSVFCFIIIQFTEGMNDLPMNFMFKFTFGVGVFMLIKVLIERLIGSAFEIDTIIDQYLFQKISYRNFLGLVLLPINALFLYSLNVSLNLIYFFLIILLIINLIGLLTSFKTHQSLIKANFFYFILYLCALEIAPYIILYKVFIT
ncbi:DUF4271 domain-containing protein [Changchengzhania lutea]|uniref:DUF4271 domain-containing protein n=1 Tax=Changchengzhania lutea TaxID=2049305 RepID=UPI00115F56C2|nr:DUF4271 domain-containing protein [Changchengzhania lutea]